jgi:hypothetical protein
LREHSLEVRIRWDLEEVNHHQITNLHHLNGTMDNNNSLRLNSLNKPTILLSLDKVRAPVGYKRINVVSTISFLFNF